MIQNWIKPLRKYLEVEDMTLTFDWKIFECIVEQAKNTIREFVVFLWLTNLPVAIPTWLSYGSIF